ncbi:YhjR family protein [Alcaligenaceae bacterium CGII-47]|nr:YhjR family protein [Alcaligenaceae bacterium CGII-47]
MMQIPFVELIDDIASLKATLNLPTLQYVDLGAEDERLAALRRWPMLAELSEQHTEPIV